MCGRYTRTVRTEELIDHFHLDSAPPVPPAYNIAPTQPVPAVRLAAPGAARELVLLRWGLVPSWARDPSIGNRMINARSETAAEKPAFRSALRRRRCLIPADGFFEWQRVNGHKQPYLFQLKDGGLFAFAGLWESGHGLEGAPLESCAILTTEANDLVRPVHDRMPVILAPDDYKRWLDLQLTDPAMLNDLLHPYPADRMAAVAVDSWVNDARHQGPRCIQPLPEPHRQAR